MTSIFISSFNCLSCGEASSFERYDRIDVSKTPQFRIALIDWELFKFTCNHCGHQVIIDYPTIDDKVIEFMKYLKSPNEEEDIMFSYEHIVFTKVGPGVYQFMFINQKEAVASLNFSSELYVDALAEVTEAGEGECFIDKDWAEKFARQR